MKKNSNFAVLLVNDPKSRSCGRSDNQKQDREPGESPGQYPLL